MKQLKTPGTSRKKQCWLLSFSQFDVDDFAPKAFACLPEKLRGDRNLAHDAVATWPEIVGGKASKKWLKVAMCRNETTSLVTSSCQKETSQFDFIPQTLRPRKLMAGSRKITLCKIIFQTSTSWWWWWWFRIFFNYMIYYIYICVPIWERFPRFPCWQKSFFNVFFFIFFIFRFQTFIF